MSVSRTIKKLLPKNKILVVALAILFVGLPGSGAWAASRIIERNNSAEQERPIALDESWAEEGSLQEVGAPQNSEAANSTIEESDPGPEPVKYSTSSDPRSTDYSTTPPAPNPASFSIKITHAGQLARGEMMFYNATKGEKGYYGGDLKLSPASVTISRNGPGTAPVAVSSYDGGLISMPSMPWNDQNPHFSIVYPSANPPSGVSSYGMVVDTYSTPPVGTYKLHIFSGCGGFGNDSCESHGFITVNVVE